tara:strand:+ start:427 stop:702 length:276 start_codon:yes stop_codon:yes gene_type:complete
MPKFNNIEEKQKFFYNAVKKLDTGLPKEASPDLIKFFVLHVITAYGHEDCWDDIKGFVDFALKGLSEFDSAIQAVEDADNLLDTITNSKDK